MARRKRPVNTRGASDVALGRGERRVNQRSAKYATAWQPGRGPERTRFVSVDAKVLTESLCTVAIAAWRLRRSLARATGEASEAERRSLRHAATIEDSLAEIGLTIQDHDGARFTTGSSLLVLAFQPTPGLQAEMVIETVKPSVYYRGQLIQMGEVIVGAPDLSPSGDSDHDRSME